MIRPEDQRLLQPCLRPGERLLWAGRPRRGLILRRSDLSLVPLALFFAAIGFTNLSEWLRGEPFSLEIDPVLAPFVLYAVFGRFFHDAWLRSALLYAVSDRRVIFLRTRWRRRMLSLEMAYLPRLVIEPEDAGRSTLCFAVEQESQDLFGNDFHGWAPSGSNRPGFEDIDHPQFVYDLIARQSERCRREQVESAVPDPIFQR